MEIFLAKTTQTYDVISFFENNINFYSSGIYNQEFLCPEGVKAAIRRGQVIVAVKNNKVIAAIRFYKKKTSNSISLYQFAISQDFRGLGILKKILSMINSMPIYALCPIDSEFNEYYSKTGWMLDKQIGKFNTWRFID